MVLRGDFKILRYLVLTVLCRPTMKRSKLIKEKYKSVQFEEKRKA